MCNVHRITLIAFLDGKNHLHFVAISYPKIIKFWKVGIGMIKSQLEVKSGGGLLRCVM